jgi:hypothetical protein
MKNDSTQEIKNTNKKQPLGWKKILTVVFLSILIFVALTALVLWGYEKVYAGKIYPGVKIASYDVGGQSPNDIKILIKSHLDNLNSRKLNIPISDGVLNPTMEEIGITFDLDRFIAEAYTFGRSDPVWDKFNDQFSSLMFSKNIVIEPEINIEKFNSYFAKYGVFSKSAKNATLKITGDKVNIVLSEEGSRINTNQFKIDLMKNISNDKLDEPIYIDSFPVEPDINEDEVALIKPYVSNIISSPIKLVYAENTYSPGAEIIAKWIIIKAQSNGELTIEFDSGKISEYVQSISDKINKRQITKKVYSDTGEVIQEGNDGLEVDQNKLLGDIKSALGDYRVVKTKNIEIIVNVIQKEEQKIEREVPISDDGTPGMYDGRYIEVNLTKQKLYAYDGYNLVGSYTVSTGKWSTPTPIGTRYIESKDERAYSSKFNLYMPWWNSLGGGYGIHELPEWSSGYKEGENHLGTPVSHGCIRLGVGPAEFIYNWAPIGTPVFIHK